MKKKLIASAVSLAMALVMLTSASFAWFTVSTAPEITSVKVSMGVSQNLEIANVTATTKETAPGEVTLSDTGKTGTWGGTATFATAAGDINFPISSLTGGAIKTISYGTDGRIDATDGQTLTLAKGTMADDGTCSFTASIDPDGSGTGTALTKNVAAGFTVWLRSNVKGAEVKATVDTSAFAATGFKNTLTKDDIIVALYDGSTYTALGSTATKVTTLTNANEVSRSPSLCSSRATRSLLRI